MAALIGIPIIGALLMLLMLFCLPIHTPLWLISVLIISFLLIMILVLKWIIRKQIFVPCSVTIDHRGMSFIIEKSHLFYGKTNFYSTWENISSIAEKFSIQNGNYSYAVVFKIPHFKANFSMMENYEDEAEDFFKTLRFYQESKKIFNNAKQNQSNTKFPNGLASN